MVRNLPFLVWKDNNVLSICIHKLQDQILNISRVQSLIYIYLLTSMCNFADFGYNNNNTFDYLTIIYIILYIIIII